jgi:hypothetical protein
MTKLQLLKIVNPIIAILILVQAVTALSFKFLAEIIPYSLFSTIHEYVGFCFVALVVFHSILNWAWIKSNFFKKRGWRMKIRSAFGLAIVLCVVFSHAQNEPTKPDSASGQAKTIIANKFIFKYKIEGQNLSAEVSYPTTGWVAIGFKPAKRMKGANFIIGYVDKGKSVVSDEYGVAETVHRPDIEIGGKNDLIKSDCKTDSGVTTLSFTIPLNSGDSKDVELKAGEATTVIFSAGKTKNTETKHSAIGRAIITF